MVVKNRSSNSNSNSDLSLADKCIQEAEEKERSQRFSKLDENDETKIEGSACRQDEDDVPKWVNEPIRFPPTLTTDSFDNHELLESPNLRLRKPAAIKRSGTAETEAESNCDFKDHSKCKRKPIGKQLVVLTKMLIFYLVYLCIGALAFSHMESDAETKRLEKEGKAFCIVFTMIGIPFFAFMVNRISDLIMESLKFLKRTLNFGKFVLHLTYIGVGFVALIFIPARIFMKIEGWSALEAVYFIIVSLTTIGFGDYSPRMDPPKEQAYSKHNETACLFELINPIPSRNVNVETGLTTSCDKDKWSDSLQKSYNIYRVAVFLWILIGLSWIGGVVNIITNFFHTGMNDMKAPKLHLKRTFISDCFVKYCIPANYKHLCSKEQLKWTTYATPAPNSPGASRKRNTKTMLMVDYDGTDNSYHSCSN
ncbi:Oidioi.mRNA.OKI2018_I69.chr2.g4197.t1.cds [Oikopleura dioica]|uniref:Oidioi.mRNA.OKI2018_I69.chr2.g4197.t1.cds n=1 Tax=Oikopleura dioica TaxID=34765 RepID=A0ABN7SWK3_OIKDI|nr:Oidioi.mRNA.OKI2018_I69.chr2.g4197.t1.cds [Oikopleura dioica]